jgi:hypothetical protein
MRESRPYGSERGAFSSGRPYRDRYNGDPHLEARRPSTGTYAPALRLSNHLAGGGNKGEQHAFVVTVEQLRWARA